LLTWPILDMRIEVVAPDSKWKGQFRREADQIVRALGDIVVAIHHIGSTAIPDIYAKPIIDILLEIDRLGQFDGRASSVLGSLGYEGLGELGISGRRYFRKNNAGGMRTHQVHAFQTGDAHIRRHLAFRDYLVAHAEVARAYSDLKQDLAKRNPEDIEAYMEGKDPFIKEHEAKALAWLGTSQ
jgi:GrpB-like predicted nucleotidyltransferase (UPF0157 family)